MSIKLLRFCFFWRPGIVCLPLIGAGLEAGSFWKFAFIFSFLPMIKPFLLQVLEISRSIAFKINFAQAIAVRPCPFSMKPGAENNEVAVKSIFLFHMRVHDLRTVQIFLVIIAANMHHGY